MVSLITTLRLISVITNKNNSISSKANWMAERHSIFADEGGAVEHCSLKSGAQSDKETPSGADPPLLLPLSVESLYELFCSFSYESGCEFVFVVRQASPREYNSRHLSTSRHRLATLFE